MRGNVSTPLKFLIFFILFSFGFLLFWPILNLLYMRLLAASGNIFWAGAGLPVSMHISERELHFAYRFVSRDPLSFTVSDAGEIYLNVIILASLIGASRFSLAIKELKPAAISLITLFFIHIFLITAYACTHIWTYARSLEPEAGEELARHVSESFPESLVSPLNAVLFQWNSWGWDVLPIVIWLGVLYTEKKYRAPIEGWFRTMSGKRAAGNV